ncbi:hypothetical protein [Oceanisphaera sediminis]|uniref:hypothetical protein n=1 Tax=Oceanisphaera sediminis TaxID=981381 RepID=UPI003CD05725
MDPQRPTAVALSRTDSGTARFRSQVVAALQNAGVERLQRHGRLRRFYELRSHH